MRAGRYGYNCATRTARRRLGRGVHEFRTVARTDAACSRTCSRRCCRGCMARRRPTSPLRSRPASGSCGSSRPTTDRSTSAPRPSTRPCGTSMRDDRASRCMRRWPRPWVTRLRPRQGTRRNLCKRRRSQGSAESIDRARALGAPPFKVKIGFGHDADLQRCAMRDAPPGMPCWRPMPTRPGR
jgi:hypothetical protein